MGAFRAVGRGGVHILVMEPVGVLAQPAPSPFRPPCLPLGLWPFGVCASCFPLTFIQELGPTRSAADAYSSWPPFTGVTTATAGMRFRGRTRARATRDGVSRNSGRAGGLGVSGWDGGGWIRLASYPRIGVLGAPRSSEHMPPRISTEDITQNTPTHTRAYSPTEQ